MALNGHQRVCLRQLHTVMRAMRLDDVNHRPVLLFYLGAGLYTCNHINAG